MDTENEDAESDTDMDELDTQADEGPGDTEGSQDTTPALLPTDLGEQMFGASCCRVRLAARSNGRTLLCGCSENECTRRRHDILRRDPEKRGLPGLYVATWNSSQTIRDALEDTYRSVVQREQDQARNRQAIQAEAQQLRTSAQRRRSDEDHTERMPATVGFIPDIEVLEEVDQTPVSTTPRQDLMAAWRSGLEGLNPATARIPTARPDTPVTGAPPTRQPRATAAPNAGTTMQGLPSPGRTQDTTDPTVLNLIKQLMNRFEEMEVAFQQSERAMEKHERMLESHINKATEATVTQNHSTDIDKSSHSTVSSANARQAHLHENAPERWYAVSVGRTLGVFTSWKGVCESVKNHPGATYKRFRNESSAQLWLQQQWRRDQPGQSMPRVDSWDDISLDVTHVEGGMNPDSERRSVGNAGQNYNHILDATRIGPDPSNGKSTELFDTSIAVESDVLKLLCPKGVTDSVKRELVEAAVDVVALPGKCAQSSTTDSANVINQLSEALGDLASYQARKVGRRPPRDAQWKNANRNALTAIKSLEDLTEATNDLSSQSALVMSNMMMSLKDILHGVGWSKEDSQLYCASGVLTRVVQESLSRYHQLLVYLQSEALRHPDSWDEVTAIYVSHHEKKLAQIRLLAPTYTQLIVQVYIYLRDSASSTFSNVSILKTITDELLSARTAPSKKAPAGEPTYTCAHCHGSFHEGGKKLCPLGDFKVKTARKIAAEYAKIVPADPAALERMITAAKEHQEQG